MKRRRQKEIIHPERRAVAMILLILLFFHSLPSAFAAGAVEKVGSESLSIDSSFTESSATETFVSGEEASGLTYVELSELRETFVKHFQREDGQRVAVVYPEAVHTLVDGEMQDVDNRLVFDAGSSRYRSLNPDFAVSFAESCATDEAVSITFDGYTVSWRVDIMRNTSGTAPWQSSTALTGQSLAEASAEKASSLAVASLTQSEFVTAEKGKHFSKAELGSSFASVAGIRYANAFTGSGSVELCYTVSENRVEEDIILHEKSNIRSYIMQMTAEGLTATKLSDDSIAFADEKGETVFTVGAPWMSDAVGAISCDITVSLAQKGSEVVVAYTPDASWLKAEERVYPILIDPSVRTKNYTANYEDTFITDAGYHVRYSQLTTTRVGISSSDGSVNESFTRFLRLPRINDTMQVTGVTMTYYSGGLLTSPKLTVLDGNANAWTVDTLRYGGNTDSDAATVHPQGTQGVYVGTPVRVTSGVCSTTFDLTSAFITRGNTYGTMDQFLQTNFHGFRLYEGSDATTVKQYFSAEWATAAYRPYLEITYTYTPYLPMVNNGVYSIQNQNSGMRITVPSSATNAFQMADTHGNNQAFRLVGGDGIFTVQPIARSGEALTWEYAGVSAEQTAVNLYSAALSSSDADKQEFIIEYVEDGSDGYPYFAILSRADTHMALTAYGTSTGSATGTTVTSRGNVYVSEYTGDASQLWCFYSGGMLCLVGNDIVEENGTTVALDYGINAVAVQPFAYVTAFGETISWESSNTGVVSFGTDGRVTVNGVGTAVLTARIKNSAGTVLRSYSYTVHIAIGNGVYYIKNTKTLTYLGLPEGSLANLVDVEMQSKATEGEAYYRQLWKVYHLGNGVYSIRSMRGLNMALDVSGSVVDVWSIGVNDTLSGVPSYARWDFVLNTTGEYRIRHQGLDTQTLYASGITVGMNSAGTTEQAVHTAGQGWTLEEVSFEDSSVQLIGEQAWVAPKESFDVDAAYYTETLRTQGVTWTSSNESVAKVDASGVVTGVSNGSAIITATSQYDSDVCSDKK